MTGLRAGTAALLAANMAAVAAVPLRASVDGVAIGAALEGVPPEVPQAKVLVRTQTAELLHEVRIDIKQHPSLDDCAICLQQLEVPVAFPAAGCPHFYCAGCLETLRAHSYHRRSSSGGGTTAVAMTCPLCRRRGLLLPAAEAPATSPPVEKSSAREIIGITLMIMSLLLCVVLYLLWIGVFSNDGADCNHYLRYPCVNETTANSTGVPTDDG